MDGFQAVYGCTGINNRSRFRVYPLSNIPTDRVKYYDTAVAGQNIVCSRWINLIHCSGVYLNTAFTSLPLYLPTSIWRQKGRVCILIIAPPSTRLDSTMKREVSEI